MATLASLPNRTMESALRFALSAAAVGCSPLDTAEDGQSPQREQAAQDAGASATAVDGGLTGQGGAPGSQGGDRADGSSSAPGTGASPPSGSAGGVAPAEAGATSDAAASAPQGGSATRAPGSCTGSGAQFGNGKIGERTLTVANLPRVRIESAFHAALTVDPAHAGELALRVRSDEDVLPRVVAEVREGVIVVGLADGAYCLSELSLEATVGPLEELSALAASEVTVHNLGGPALRLSADGASRIEASGQVERWEVQLANASRGQLSVAQAALVELELSGASQVSLAGSVADLTLLAEATSELSASPPGFEAQRARVELAGISSARVCVRGKVDGVVQGLSKLFVACGAEIEVDGPALRE